MFPGVKIIQRRWHWIIYTEWVNQVLKPHKSPIPVEFKVYFDFDHKWKSDINERLKFALARGVRILELNLSWEDSVCASMTELIIMLFHSIRIQEVLVAIFLLGALKKCSSHVNMSGEALEYLLSNCSLLELLIVGKSNALLNVRVTNPSFALKYLEIFYCKNIQSIEICNVNLVSFVYKGRVTNSNLHLENVPLLVELHVWLAGSLSVEEDLFPKLPCCFHQLETLGLKSTRICGLEKRSIIPHAYIDCSVFSIGYGCVFIWIKILECYFSICCLYRNLGDFMLLLCLVIWKSQ